jgi:hypothetical protein
LWSCTVIKPPPPPEGGTCGEHSGDGKTQLKMNEELMLKSATPPKLIRINKVRFKKKNCKHLNNKIKWEF